MIKNDLFVLCPNKNETIQFLYQMTRLTQFDCFKFNTTLLITISECGLIATFSGNVDYSDNKPEIKFFPLITPAEKNRS